MGSERKQEGKYADLPDAKQGQVVVRFPPEASGYLHIGHAKAALLNQYYAESFNGKLVFRFDDTNPEKENVHFEDVITEDLKLLHVKYDVKSYTSDHFEVFLKFAEKLIADGKAYVDDTPAEQMKQERESRTESKNRNASVQTNQALWKEMLAATAKGTSCCLRAKIDMQSNNGCLRDPTIYRCKAELHPRTKDKYKVYPTYDFACPIVDSVEGITHALRTTEYTDRDQQYYWFCDALGIRKPLVCSYARLNMKHTVMSKRKLTWLVQERYVEGWDDPRLPTVRGVFRRGMTVEGLKQFIIAQGSSRSVVFMDWDKIWGLNRKVIDPVAVRYVGVELRDATIVTIDGGGTQPDELEVNCHPKNPELGKRKVKLPTNCLLIDQFDAQALKVDENVTFVNFGNLLVTSISKHPSGLVTGVTVKLNLENTDYKKTQKITWLPDCGLHNARATCVYYEHLVSKPEIGKDEDFTKFVSKDTKKEVEMFVDSDLSSRVKKGDIIQLQRKGFFIVDSPPDRPLRLISIPDGSADLNIFPVVVKDWKKRLQAKAEENAKPLPPKAVSTNSSADSIDNAIKAQGDVIRELKSKKVPKDQLQPEINKLLALKTDYKNATGKDWTPSANPTPAPVPAPEQLNGSAKENKGNAASDQISAQIQEQGDKIRKLKSAKADKSALDPEIAALLSLKAEYKKVTGSDWTSPPSNSAPKKEQKQDQKQAQPKQKKQPSQAPNKASNEGLKKPPPGPSQAASAASGGDQAGGKKQTRLGMEKKKADSFPDWYTEVITKAEMIEYYDVSGCYVLRPWAFSIWESIQSFFDKRIKDSGVRNCYFPMFVSKGALEREATHIADFAPEVAWVTKSGQSELAEPIAIRPTSETVMYPSYAKWVQSHRDLPIRLNQWCNVVRWEFKCPTPFLRTREFLWQEGHSAFANKQEAEDEVREILEYYAAVYEQLLAIPVIRGRKTEKEKFAGGDYTTTVEGYIPANGRGIQGATSHHLGQNFSKMFDITYEDPSPDAKPGDKCYAYQNSWGLSTRTIGVLIMVHGDDKGLVLPPEVACIQVVIVPCGITSETSQDAEDKLLAACRALGSVLKVQGGVRVHIDLDKNRSPGWKFNNWELKGVPLRVELGPKDLEKKSFIAVRRDTGDKISVSLENSLSETKRLLDLIQKNLYDKAKSARDSHLLVTESWEEFQKKLDEKFLLLAPFCGAPECEDSIKRDSARDELDLATGTGSLMGAKSLCIPFEQPKELASQTKCIYPSCTRKPHKYTLFGRSY